MNEYNTFSFPSNNSVKIESQKNNLSVSKSLFSLRRFSCLNFSYDINVETKKLWINDVCSKENIGMSKSSLIQERGNEASISKILHYKSSEDLFVFNNFSQQSILFAMNRFVKSVINMQSTVLIPSKLKDLEVNTSKKKVRFKGLKEVKQMRTLNHHAVCALSKPSILINSDLYTFYNMLNEIKKELLWGNGDISSVTNFMSCSSENRNHSFDCNQSSFCKNNHARQPSVASLGSVGLTLSSVSTVSTLSTSNSDQETDDSETDSLLTERDSIDEHTSRLAGSFRFHSQGLHNILDQLTDAATYISARYQQELESSS